MLEPVDVLITGGAGQVGLELQAGPWPANVRIHAPTRAEMDLANADSITAMFGRTTFAAVISAGAWTAVDKAETEVAAAFAANALGPAVLADITRALDIPLIHVSTDYVFDGAKDDPYSEHDPVGPLGVYGASKLAGELAVLTGNSRSVVMRSAWVLSVHRSNFLKTMLRLAADQPTLRIVGDQHGCPTSARDIARALIVIALRMISDRTAPSGVYHFVNSGETTWAGLAKEIFTLSTDGGGPFATVEPIPTADYHTPARRPLNSRLATDRIFRDYGIQPRPWQAAVAEIVSELHAKGLSA